MLIFIEEPKRIIDTTDISEIEPFIDAEEMIHEQIEMDNKDFKPTEKVLITLKNGSKFISNISIIKMWEVINATI